MAKQRTKPSSARKINLDELPNEKHLSTEDAAAGLGLSPDTLQTWRCRKRGPAYYKIGRLAYYCVADLKTWREKQRCEPKAA